MQTRGPDFWARTFVWMGFLACLFVTLPASLDRQERLGIDFPIFYSAALHHGDTEGYIYPPFLAWAISPLTLLNARTAALVWYILQGAAILYVLWVCMPRAGWSQKKRLIVTTVYLVATLRLVLLNAELGQVNGLLTLLVLVAIQTRHAAVAGSALGMASMVKISPVIVLPFSLLARKRGWKTLLFACVLLLLACTVLPLWSGYNFSGLTRLFAVQQAASANLGLGAYLGYASDILFVALLAVSLLVAARTDSPSEALLLPVLLMMIGPGFVRKAHLLWGILLGPLVDSREIRLAGVPLLWGLGSLGTMLFPEAAVAGNLLALLLLLFCLWKGHSTAGASGGKAHGSTAPTAQGNT